MKLKYSIIVIVFALVAPSCKKWLTVHSSNEIINKQQFSDITGFRDAVIGVYQQMAKPELYSMHMTWRTVEFLSQQYAVVAGAPDLTVPTYAWTGTVLNQRRESIWINMYNAIANINLILEYQQKNRGVFDQYPITDSLIRGEMLGLRAFLHFDLMRLFGKGNLAGRPELQSALAIPYVTTFSKNPTPQRTYKETFALLNKDIEEAIVYLKAGPLSGIRPESDYDREYAGGFISTESRGTSSPNRKMRMNYWAAKALYARILMWEGTPESKEKALTEAREVMGTPLSNGLGIGEGAIYSWVTSRDISMAYWYTSDLSFVNEQLFTLQVEKFLDIQRTGTIVNWFYSGSPNNQYAVVFLTDARRKAIFENGSPLIDIDWRATKCLFPDGSQLNNWTIAKFYNTEDMSVKYDKRMPLIRISEMYYIAAECYMEPGSNYDRNKAVACLNTVRNHRNITTAFDLQASDLTDAEIKNEITKEYLKEFIGEGQLFFFYKRLGMKNIMDYGPEMTDDEYQMPMPESEIQNGGVRTN